MLHSNTLISKFSCILDVTALPSPIQKLTASGFLSERDTNKTTSHICKINNIKPIKPQLKFYKITLLLIYY